MFGGHYLYANWALLYLISKCTSISIIVLAMLPLISGKECRGNISCPVLCLSKAALSSVWTLLVQVIEKERASERAEWVGDSAPRGEMEPLQGAPRHQSASVGANGTSRADPQQQQLPNASAAAQQQGSAAAPVLVGGPSSAPRLSAQDLQPMANGSEQQRKLPD